MEKYKEAYREIADTLEKVAQYLRDGDEISRGVFTRREYIERLYALMVGITILRERAGGLPYEN